MIPNFMIQLSTLVLGRIWCQVPFMTLDNGEYGARFASFLYQKGSIHRGRTCLAAAWKSAPVTRNLSHNLTESC